MISTVASSAGMGSGFGGTVPLAGGAMPFMTAGVKPRNIADYVVNKYQNPFGAKLNEFYNLSQTDPGAAYDQLFTAWGDYQTGLNDYYSSIPSASYYSNWREGAGKVINQSLAASTPQVDNWLNIWGNMSGRQYPGTPPWNPNGSGYPIPSGGMPMPTPSTPPTMPTSGGEGGSTLSKILPYGIAGGLSLLALLKGGGGVDGQQQEFIKQMMERNKAAYDQAFGYYSGVVKGGPELDRAVGPAANRVNQIYDQQDKNALERAAARGGALDKARRTVASGRAMSLSDLYGNAQAQGAAGLASLAGANAQMAASGLASAQQAAQQNQQMRSDAYAGLGSMFTRILTTPGLFGGSGGQSPVPAAGASATQVPPTQPQQWSVPQFGSAIPPAVTGRYVY